MSEPHNAHPTHFKLLLSVVPPGNPSAARHVPVTLSADEFIDEQRVAKLLRSAHQRLVADMKADQYLT